MPNAWDIGSARVLESLGFPAIATTSAGFAAALGRMDQEVTAEEVAAHVRDLASTVDVPVSVDAENCYADTDDGIRATIDMLAEAGAAGLSIEDYSPATGVYPFEQALSRVAVAVEAAHRHGMILTARSENFFYKIDDLDDTIRRLAAFREAGADVLYAPHITKPDVIGRVVEESGGPVNVLLLAAGPSVGQLTEMGVRRVSLGGFLTFAAYGALAAAGREILDTGTVTFTERNLSFEDRVRAFSDG
jgi:2-methylisocitrate lyase-like PEP mutase family enzyme